jgi:selenocysteine-specific elongation factor
VRYYAIWRGTRRELSFDLRKPKSLSMKSIIIGTAGHIDHGKTALVRALTGIDADRLPEEKRRGITIDIGFADLDLGDVRIGFVDVPGHERFVKNMLAGAHGIDVVALVIAADESVMPQTREHLDICRMLGVRHGLVVLTKKDLVDQELLELVTAETRALVAGSFLDGAPIIAVSSRTGAGIDNLKRALRETGLATEPRSDAFVTRLPIDRVFTMRGFGAVVTGTLISGSICEGDEMELLPARTKVRVRGVQVHGSPVARAHAGQRTAINLSGVDAATIERGMVLAPTVRLRPTLAFDARIDLLKSAPRSLRSRQRLSVHIGAAEVLARVRVLADGGEISPGQSGLVQLRTEAPMIGVRGDRFIVRSYSPQLTIGGGLVLDPFPPRHRSRDLAAVRARLETLSKDDRAQHVEAFVTGADRYGLRRADLAARTGWTDEIIEAATKQALSSVSVIDAEGVLLDVKRINEFKKLVKEAVATHHQHEPLMRGLAKEVLRERLFAHTPIEVFRAVLASLEAEQALVSEQDVVRLREHTRELSTEDSNLRDRLEEIYKMAGLLAPNLTEALQGAGASGQQGRKILQLLIDSGQVVRVHGEMFFHRAALDDLVARVREHGAAAPNRSIDVAAFKDLAGISRKYAIPLLEYLDRLRVTRREGDQRIVL